MVATAFVQEGVGAREDRVAAGDGEAAARGGDWPISRGRRLLTWRNALLGGLGAFALWGVVAAAWLLTGRGAASALGGDEADVRTLAVLPFENLGDPRDAYFCGGRLDPPSLRRAVSWLRIDPTLAALRGNPRFERLAEGGASS